MKDPVGKLLLEAEGQPSHPTWSLSETAALRLEAWTQSGALLAQGWSLISRWGRGLGSTENWSSGEFRN